MNITLVISSLTGGGAERVMSIIANYWVSNENTVTLITLDSKKNDFYSIDMRVRRIGLDLIFDSTSFFSALKNNYVRLMKLRYAIRSAQPNVVISFEDTTNIMTLLSVLGLHVPVIVSERSDPRYHSITSIYARLRNLLYPLADAVVVQTDVVGDWASELVPANRVHVIPNPVMPFEQTDNAVTQLDISPPFIVALGRLVPLKGFDLLLKAFARSRYDDWSLVIIGEGHERRNLEILIKQLDLETHVYLPGRIKEPNNILMQADLFVLSSQYEGFPNALLEAMSCGLAVISFDCPSGPGVLIINGENGILVPPMNVDRLSAAMIKLMYDEDLRKKLGGRARNVVDEFSVKKIMRMWDELINKVI